MDSQPSQNEDRSYHWREKPVWRFEPHYWNGTAWTLALGCCKKKPAPKTIDIDFFLFAPKGVHLAPKIDKKEITVLSYNIWFGQVHMAERMKG